MQYLYNKRFERSKEKSGCTKKKQEMFLFLFSTQREILVYADPPGRTFFLSVVRRKRKGRANINCDIRTEMKADIYFATAQKISVLSLPSFLLLPSKSQISMWSFLLHRKLQLRSAITGNSTFVYHGMGIAGTKKLEIYRWKGLFEFLSPYEKLPQKHKWKMQVHCI